MKIKSNIKKYGIYLLIIIGIILFSIALYSYEHECKYLCDQIAAAAACTVFTAVITMFLIHYNSSSDRELNKSQKVFEKKQEAYLEFIKELENITRNGKINISHFEEKKDDDKESFFDQMQDIIFQLNFVKLHCTNDKIMGPITDSVSNIIHIMNKLSSEIQNFPKNMQKEAKEKAKQEKLYDFYLQLEENIDVIIDNLWADLTYDNKGEFSDYVENRQKEIDFIQKMLVNSNIFGVEKENQEEIASLTYFFESLEKMIIKYFGKENISFGGWDSCFNDSIDWKRNAAFFIKQINKKSERIITIKINKKVEYKIVFSFDDNKQFYICNIIKNKKRIQNEECISDLIKSISSSEKNVNKIRRIIIDDLKRNHYTELLLSYTEKKLTDFIINRDYEKKVKRKLVKVLIHKDNFFTTINKHRFPIKNEYINWYESILDKSAPEDLKLLVAKHCIKNYSIFYNKKKNETYKSFCLYKKKYMDLMDKCCTYINEESLTTPKMFNKNEKGVIDLIKKRKDALIEDTLSIISKIDNNELITTTFMEEIDDILEKWEEDVFNETVFNNLMKSLVLRLKNEMETSEFKAYKKRNRRKIEKFRDTDLENYFDVVTDILGLFDDFLNED